MRLCTIDPRDDASPAFHWPESNGFEDIEHAFRMEHANTSATKQRDFIVTSHMTLFLTYPAVAGCSTVAPRRNFAASSGGVGLI
jgi:hypothetical protein